MVAESPHCQAKRASTFNKLAGALKMIENEFDSRTRANMDVALERVCKGRPDGEHHEIRKRVAESMIRCAKSGNTSLTALTDAGLTALAKKRKSA
jgi:hypothetical protein